MVIIELDQLIITSDLNEHNFLENTKKLSKYSRKFDYKQQYKSIIESAKISTPGGLTKNSPVNVTTLLNLNDPSAITFLFRFFLDNGKYTIL